MEALKTASFSPMSVFLEKRAATRKPFSFRTSLFPPKPISQEIFLKSFNGRLALLTSVLSNATASAISLSYERKLCNNQAAADLRQMGSPNIKGLGKNTVSAVYNGEDKPGCLKKLSLKFKDPENTTP
ncbi:unnamed protein product [Eruca vesicaria subsp. sativa]|uniref:Uncharacterized protein n=1 Tax=Eruca vesicaria subsp. sativa TaxID=29727 RepID=A0ABC8KYD0_ERUVS|nr:unnamed protein product [Eruca vesicaria subsp. sativa]